MAATIILRIQTPELYTMDEYNQGWDPEVQNYFRKILNSFGVVVFWLLLVATLGIFFRLAFIPNGWRWYNVAFYLLFFATLVLIVRFLVCVWRKGE